jgi:3-hydroxyisobutyrate dehydrogenase-like beta-hydroxyacid dehydrogenase
VGTYRLVFNTRGSIMPEDQDKKDIDIDAMLKDLNIVMASLAEHIELLQEQVATIVSDVEKFKDSL